MKVKHVVLSSKPEMAETALPAKKLTPEEFTVLAIKVLRSDGKKGIHTVWSNFNVAFRKYFPGLNPVEETERLVAERKIELIFVKGGAIIYLPGEGPKIPSADETLKKMGL